MKKTYAHVWHRAVSFVLLMVMSFTCCYISASAATQVQITYTGTNYSSGQVVDTFNSVPSKYTTADSDTGDFSCAGYVKDYYSHMYGITVSNMYTGATPVVSSGTIKTTTSPKAGDIGYQTNSSGSGHWFIIKSVSGSTCTVIEQNWKWTSGGKTYCYNGRTVNSSTSGIKYFHWTK